MNGNDDKLYHDNGRDPRDEKPIVRKYTTKLMRNRYAC